VDPHALHAFIDRCQAATGPDIGSRVDLFERLQRAIDDLPDDLNLPDGLIAAGLLWHIAFAERAPGSATGMRTKVTRRELLTFHALLAGAANAAPEPVAHVGARRALDIINRQFSDPHLTLPSLARRVGVSPCHLARILKKHTGRAFLWHLHTARIDASKHLLESTTRSVKEIAALTGYSDTTLLCRHFRRRCGVSPLFYRATVACLVSADARAQAG
jgi:AraC-like DNA-binding protein